MKSIVVVTFFLAFGITHLAPADDIVRSNAGKQYSVKTSAKVTATHAQPTTVARRLNIASGKSQAGIRPHLRIRPNYPAPAPQPISQSSLALNVQRTPRTNKPSAIGERSDPVRTIARPNAGVQSGAGNNQAPNANRRSYFDALSRSHRGRHDRHWWNTHCRTIVFVNTGYYYLDASYWYPAYGYSQTYDSYDSDGPIYTYANLLPDQVIANVQAALRDAGYYVGPITGSLGPATRAAISNFQRDYGLIITGAIDQPTVQSLGLS